MKWSSKVLIITLVTALLSAVIWGLAVILVEWDQNVHYHANIAIFIDGKKVDLSDSKYMEDTTACAIDPTKQRPEDRTHFHENNGDLVHVHAAGVTWGHLMSNIGWAFGDNYLIDDTGKIYLKNGSGSMHFILNGKAVDNPFNTLIKSTDRLLIDYGTQSEDKLIETEFKEVAATAEEANKKDDPATCGGWASSFIDSVRNMFHGHEY